MLYAAPTTSTYAILFPTLTSLISSSISNAFNRMVGTDNDKSNGKFRCTESSNPNAVCIVVVSAVHALSSTKQFKSNTVFSVSILKTCNSPTSINDCSLGVATSSTGTKTSRYFCTLSICIAILPPPSTEDAMFVLTSAWYVTTSPLVIATEILRPSINLPIASL